VRISARPCHKGFGPGWNGRHGQTTITSPRHRCHARDLERRERGPRHACALGQFLDTRGCSSASRECRRVSVGGRAEAHTGHSHTRGYRVVASLERGTGDVVRSVCGGFADRQTHRSRRFHPAQRTESAASRTIHQIRPFLRWGTDSACGPSRSTATAHPRWYGSATGYRRADQRRGRSEYRGVTRHRLESAM